MQNSVNHRIFERTLRSMAIRRACLFECHEISHPKRFLHETAWRMGSGWVPLPVLNLSPQARPKCMSALGHFASASLVGGGGQAVFFSRHGMIRHLLCRPMEECLVVSACASNLPLWHIPISLLVSNQVGSPAELKHINKRRKRN